jgi:hypothetical protein
MKPCHANPQTKYTMAATERADSEAIIMWAALRDLPNPALISDRPAPAKGTRKMKKRQAAVAVSVSPGTGISVILFPLAESSGTG